MVVGNTGRPVCKSKRASATYAYNGDGLRQSKTVNGTTTQQTWDEAEGLPLLIQDGTTTEIDGPDGLSLAQITGSGTVSYYVHDQLGSTMALVAIGGQIASTYDYDAYGALRASTITSGIDTTFRYAGQDTDPESGLQYLRARYYDPSSSQFLTVDPMSAQTGEPYGYTAGNPLSAVDSSGLFCVGNTPIPFEVGSPGERWLGRYMSRAHRASRGSSEALLTGSRGGEVSRSNRTAKLSWSELGTGGSELDNAVSVSVGVLEPRHSFVAQFGDSLLVRLEPIGVVVLEGDAVSGEFVHGLLDVNDLPGRDRAARLTGAGGRGVDVDLTPCATLVRDSAVEDGTAFCESELGFVELSSCGHV
jgi:RHS repeat-associated protein